MFRIDLNKVIDLRKVDWNTPTSGSSDGILPKSTFIFKGKKVYAKLGSYSTPYGVYGREPLIELINSRIGALLMLPVLEFSLIKCCVILEGKQLITFAAISNDFKPHEIVGYSIKKWYSKYKIGNEMPIDTIKRYRLQDNIYKQFVYDYIICNLDRHGKNTEILLGNNNIRIAPFFDNSLTFITNRPDNEIKSKKKFNEQIMVNNFIGTRSLKDNLNLIDSNIQIRNILNSDRQKLFQGLSSITSRQFRDYVWCMLNWRVSDVKQQGIHFIQWR